METRENEMKALYDRLAEQLFRLKGARSNGTMVNQEMERMKNLMLNSADAIVAALERTAALEERIEVLEADLDSADAELKEMDEEIKKLRQAAQKVNNKPKPAPAEKTNE